MKYVLDFDIYREGKGVLISLRQAVKIFVANGYSDDKRAIKSKLENEMLHLSFNTAIYKVGKEKDKLLRAAVKHLLEVKNESRKN